MTVATVDIPFVFSLRHARNGWLQIPDMTVGALLVYLDSKEPTSMEHWLRDGAAEFRWYKDGAPVAKLAVELKYAGPMTELLGAET